MNTTLSSLPTASTDYPWATPRDRRSSARDPRRDYQGLFKHYVLASESPLNSDDDRDSVLSIQAKETDYVRDTSDTESYSDGSEMEYEPATEPESAGDAPPVHASEDTSGDTDKEIISTKVMSVAVLDEAELEFADSEQSEPCSDPELGPHDYWRCAQCRAANNNPLYRYCEKCFKVRKNFFPPRPKRKCRQSTKSEPNSELREVLLASLPPSASALARVPSHSGVDSAYNSQEFSGQEASELNSQELSQGHDASAAAVPSLYDLCGQSLDILKPTDSSAGRLLRAGEGATGTKKCVGNVNSDSLDIPNVILGKKSSLKRRAESRSEQPSKRRYGSASPHSSHSSHSSRASNSSSSSSSEDDDARTGEPSPIVKTLSDPSLTLRSLGAADLDLRSVSDNESGQKRISKKALINSLKEKVQSSEDNMCIVCCSEPKSGVFVHGRIAHICCCYRCAVKVWAKAKRCPVCNCKVSNVLKAVIS